MNGANRGRSWRGVSSRTAAMAAVLAALEAVFGGISSLFGIPIGELLVPFGYLPQVGWAAVLGVTIGKGVTDLLIPQSYALAFTAFDVPLTALNTSFAVLMGRIKLRRQAVLFPVLTNSVGTAIFFTMFVAPTSSVFSAIAAPNPFNLFWIVIGICLAFYGVLAIPQYFLLRYLGRLSPKIGGLPAAPAAAAN